MPRLIVKNFMYFEEGISIVYQIEDLSHLTNVFLALFPKYSFDRVKRQQVYATSYYPSFLKILSNWNQ